MWWAYCGKRIRFIPMGYDVSEVCDDEVIEVITDNGGVRTGHLRHRCKEGDNERGTLQNRQGLMHYKLPNKQEVENEVIKLWRDLGGGQDADKDTFEVETTAE